MGKLANKVGCFKCEQHGEMKNVDLCTQTSVKCDRIKNKISWASEELSLNNFFPRVSSGGKIKHYRLEFPGNNMSDIPVYVRLLKNETFKKEASKIQKEGKDLIVLQVLNKSSFDGKAILYLKHGWIVSFTLVPQDRGTKELIIDKRYEDFNILGGIRITKKESSLDYSIELQLFAGSGHYSKCLDETTIRIGRLMEAIDDTEHNIFNMKCVKYGKKINEIHNIAKKTYKIENILDNYHNNNNNNNYNNNNNNNNMLSSLNGPQPMNIDFILNDRLSIPMPNIFDDPIQNFNNNNSIYCDDTAFLDTISDSSNSVISTSTSSISSTEVNKLKHKVKQLTSTLQHKNNMIEHFKKTDQRKDNIIAHFKKEDKNKDNIITELKHKLFKYQSAIDNLKNFDVDKPLTNSSNSNSSNFSSSINENKFTEYPPLPSFPYGFPMQYNNNCFDINMNVPSYNDNNLFYYPQSTQHNFYSENNDFETDSKFEINIKPVKRPLERDEQSDSMCSALKKQRLNTYQSDSN